MASSRWIRVDGRVEVRVAHPLYGEVRREPRATDAACDGCGDSSPMSSQHCDGRDDMRIVVRRAALEPRLRRHTRSATCSCEQRKVLCGSRIFRWPIGWPRRHIRAGAGAEANFVRAYALVVAQPRPAGRCGARRHPHQRVERRRQSQTRLPAGHQQAVHARRPHGCEEAHRRRVAHHITAGP